MTKDDLPKYNPADSDEALLPPEKQLPDYKEALAEQPTQGAVGFYHKDSGLIKCFLSSPPDVKSEWLDVYTHPPKQWQGLSDFEISELWGKSQNDVEGVNFGFTTQEHFFAGMIEAKLREKNT